jgi:hypothetical protein
LIIEAASGGEQAIAEVAPALPPLAENHSPTYGRASIDLPIFFEIHGTFGPVGGAVGKSVEQIAGRRHVAAGARMFDNGPTPHQMIIKSGKPEKKAKN